jgi:hypothetical protein
MKSKVMISTVIFLLFCISFSGAQNMAKKNSYKPFENAEIYFEQNATDGDAEVVFKAKAGDEGMTRLMIVAPDGRTVIDFEAPDVSTMGIRQFQLESPEPEDIDAVKKAYPEGVYRFSGTTTDGKEYMSEAVLDHTLPATVKILYPEHEAEDVPASELEIRWTPVEGVEKYLVEIELEKLEIKIEAVVLASETSFIVPA